MIYINGHDLTIEQVIAVSRQGETVAIAPEARERINAARAYVDRKLADKAVVYGLTTGFGKFSTVFVPEEETAQLQRNLIISHACGMGEPLDTRVVRAAMLLRLNALARGNSGIRLSTMETLLQMAPCLCAVLTLTALLRETGLLGALTEALRPALEALRLPGEAAAVVLLRPLSGSAALAAVSDVMARMGADSRAARLCCVISGASETVFFTASLYLGAAGVKRSRYAVPAALVAYAAGVLAAAWLV